MTAVQKEKIARRKLSLLQLAGQHGQDERSQRHHPLSAGGTRAGAGPSTSPPDDRLSLPCPYPSPGRLAASALFASVLLSRR